MAKKDKEGTAGAKAYEVLTPVEMDRRYEPGETIELEDQDAGPLLAVKAIKDPTAKD